MDAESDQYVCGGIHFELNLFEHNTPVTKVSSGGALALVCDKIDAEERLRGEYSSGFVPNQLRTKIWLEDQLGRYKFMVYKSGHGVVNNIFLENATGQKGTAVYTRNLQNLHVTENLFKGN